MGLLNGKSALVTGVTNKKSIAWGIALALYGEGARIAFTCIPNNVRRVKKLAPQVESATVIPCDLRDEEEISEAMSQVARAFEGKLDILVHSVAYADLEDLGGEFIAVSKSGWNLAMEVSVYSLVSLARHARPLMNKSGAGSIITLTFAGGDKVVPGYNMMGVAKAALDMSVRYLAYDLGPEKIRVNAISSGPIPTMSSMAVEDFSGSLRLVEERAPLLRNVDLEDVGGTAVYLASDLSNAVTGAVIKVDGGLNILAPATKPHGRSLGRRKSL
jgi:enoyl-[acyl-carrier protein] reductase I